MPAGAVVNFRTKSSSIRKHSTTARRWGLFIPNRISRSLAISLAMFCGALRQEVFGLDLRGIDDFEMVEDDLKRTLENLGFAAHVQEITGLEQSGQALAGVPEARADGARLVAELEVQIQVPLPIGSKLLVSDQKRLVDRIAVGRAD